MTTGNSKVSPADALRAPPSFQMDSRGYVHPRSEAELCEVVRWARKEGVQLRVRGSSHSVPGAIHCDARLRPASARRGVEVMLDRYDGMTFDDEKCQVTVEAGCVFGADPRDPTARYMNRPGLCTALDHRGWALPNMGGVSHVTVGGFLSTGAAGSSATKSLGDAIVRLRFVDGTGEVHELTARDGDAFDAAAVSLGLFGIVSRVTFQCVPRFHLKGSEAVCTIERAPFKMFEDGPGSLEAFFRETPYARVLWWPQRGVDKLTIWQAAPMKERDYDRDTGPVNAFRPKPYEPFDLVMGSRLPMQVAAGAALRALGLWRHGLSQVPAGGAMVRALELAGARRAEGALINEFVPEDKHGPRTFWDTWHRVLPMDDCMDVRAMPTTFTELWLPLSKTGEAMRRLRDLYARDEKAAGHFVVELYAAKESRFWLSPAVGEPMVRLNFFWLEVNPGDPRADYFPRFWKLFDDLGARLHWAKVMPLEGAATAKRLAACYPRWKEFLALRKRYDPDAVFLTDYWRTYLGLEGASDASVATPNPNGQPFDALPDAHPRAWPLLFPFGAADGSLVDTARFCIDVSQEIDAPPTEVFRYFENLQNNAEWVSAYVDTTWISEPAVLENAVVDQTFTFMTIRVRAVESVPAQKWVGSVVACSLPLGTRMVERVDFSPAEGGGTHVRFRVAYDLPRPLVPFNVVVQPLFTRLFSSSLKNLAKHFSNRV